MYFHIPSHLSLVFFNDNGLACMGKSWYILQCRIALIKVKQVVLVSLRASVQSKSMPSLNAKQLVLFQ